MYSYKYGLEKKIFVLLKFKMHKMYPLSVSWEWGRCLRILASLKILNHFRIKHIRLNFLKLSLKRFLKTWILRGTEYWLTKSKQHRSLIQIDSGGYIHNHISKWTTFKFTLFKNAVLVEIILKNSFKLQDRNEQKQFTWTSDQQSTHQSTGQSDL